MKKTKIIINSLIILNCLSFSFAAENPQQFITSLENWEDFDTLTYENWLETESTNQEETTELMDPADLIQAITNAISNSTHTISDIIFDWFLKWDANEILSNWFSRELTNAYNFSYNFGITTQPSIENANLNWGLSRIAMAKMISEFATNILWIEYTENWDCYFSDVTDNTAKEYNNWVCKAYYLWIMWKNMPNNQFRPFDTVSRAEFATALSRLLFNTPDWNDFYYTTHLKKLYEEWIINNTNPSLQEVRWYVMLMLMRAVL